MGTALLIPEIWGVSLVVYLQPHEYYVYYPKTEIDLDDMIRQIKKQNLTYIVTRTSK